jgi:hypothetical protein
MKTYTIKSIFQIMTGFSFVSQSQAFTENYVEFLGGKNTDFKMSPALSLYYKLDFSKNLRPCILFDYSTTTFTDNYSQNIVLSGKTNYRSIAEQMNANTTTILLCLEYLSVPSPYRSFAGIGAGLAYSSINWIETVTSNADFEKRKSGLAFDDDNYSLALRIYSGIDLEFDKDGERQFLGGMHFEGSFLWLYRRIPVFKNIRSQISNPPDYWSNEISFLPFYINLNAGISFNLYHNFLKK